jgi:hypothetical protein
VGLCSTVSLWACGHVGLWACGPVGLWACVPVGLCACVGLRACWHVVRFELGTSSLPTDRFPTRLRTYCEDDSAPTEVLVLQLLTLVGYLLTLASQLLTLASVANVSKSPLSRRHVPGSAISGVDSMRTGQKLPDQSQEAPDELFCPDSRPFLAVSLRFWLIPARNDGRFWQSCCASGSLR